MDTRALFLFGLGLAGGVIVTRLLAKTSLPLVGRRQTPEVEGASESQAIARNILDTCDRARPMLLQLDRAQQPGSSQGSDLSPGEMYALLQQVNRMTA